MLLHLSPRIFLQFDAPHQNIWVATVSGWVLTVTYVADFILLSWNLYNSDQCDIFKRNLAIICLSMCQKITESSLGKGLQCTPLVRLMTKKTTWWDAVTSHLANIFAICPTSKYLSCNSVWVSFNSDIRGGFYFTFHGIYIIQTSMTSSKEIWLYSVYQCARK